MTTIRKSARLYVPCLAALALVLALGATPALADTCTTSSANSCSIDLTVTNGFAPSGPTYGTVSLALNEDGTISVNVSTTANYGLHNAVFGFNTASGVGSIWDFVNSYSYVGTNPGSPATNTGQHEDGFGTFEYGFSGGTGSSSDYTNLNFTVGTNGGFTAVSQLIAGSTGGSGNAHNWFGAQIAYIPTGCTGFVGNAGSVNGGGTPNCVDTTTVPEPASIALFGTGLVALASIIRKRKKQVSVS